MPEINHSELRDGDLVSCTFLAEVARVAASPSTQTYQFRLRGLGGAHDIYLSASSLDCMVIERDEKPLVAGDEVVTPAGHPAVIRMVDGGACWLRFDDGSHGTISVADLTRRSA